MILAISTHWNAGRHSDGHRMIEEIISLGFQHVELGYNLTADLVPGVDDMVRRGTVTVQSVHNFCPVPIGAPYGHPELFLLTSLDRVERENAVRHTLKTVDFAGSVGARIVVVHAGRVEMHHLTRDLMALAEKGLQYSAKYERIKMKLLMQREKKAARHLDALCRSIEQMAPTLQNNGIRLGLENLPSWESVPTESEMETILQRFDSSVLCYWHDIGHGQIRQNMGFISHRRWLDRLSPGLGGMHVHDVRPPTFDHLMPPHGNIDFRSFIGPMKSGIVAVLEPAPGTPEQEILEATRLIRQMETSATDGG